ncbi:MAG: Ig-like domain-containing protein, partial [Pseudomonadota bacterium]
VEEIVAEDTATVTIVIEGENDVVVQNPPVAEDDAKTINEDEAIAPGTSQSLNILDNDSDPDGDAISVAAVAGGAVGAAFAVTTAGGVETQVRVDADGEVTFDTAGLFDTLALGDTDSFQLTYTVTDGNGGFDDAVVTITILGLNEPPVATNNANVTDEETAVSGNVLTDDDGFGVDSDPNGDALTVTEVSFGSVGVSTTVTTDSGNFDGELIVNADGTYTFTPGEGFKVLNPGDQETVSFSYTISDGNGGEDTANVVITVNGLNEPPEATDNRAVTDEETAVGGNVLTDDDGFGVDSDPDGDTLTVVGVSFGDVGTTTTVTTDSGEFEGELTVNDDGTYTFVPGTGLEVLNPGEQETVTFTYTVSDGNGGTDTAETIITINGLNEPPVAIDDAITIFEDETVGFDGATLNVLENDSDPDGDPLSVTDVQGAAPGTPVMVTTAGGVDLEVVIQSDGTLQFDPGDALLFLNDGESDSFTVDYTANDGNGGTDDATVTVTIEGKSEGPTTSYNVVFLVDTSLSTGAAGDGSALIGSQGPLDLNGDGIENSVLDAYLNTVQKISDKLGTSIGADAEAEIGVYGFSTPLEVGEPNERPTALDDGGRTIFEAGEDLSGAFGGAEAANVAAYNTAFSAANEFFDATTANDAANTVNLVFLLSDGFGTEFTAGGDPTLAEELSVLTGTHGATAETFITDPFGTIAPLVNDIENTAGDGVIQVATNEAQVNAFIETIDDNLLV